MKVVRVIRPAGTVLLDGYLYVWPDDKTPVDVLPQHRRAVLAVKGARQVEVEVVDPPLILPAVVEVEPLPDTTVPPEPPQETPDLTGVKVKKPVLPVPETLPDTLVRPDPPAEPADLSKAKVKKPVLPEPESLPDTLLQAEPVPETVDLTGAWVDPDTVPVVHRPPQSPPRPTPEVPVLPPATVPPRDLPEPHVLPKVSHRWSDADLARLEADIAAVRGG